MGAVQFPLIAAAAGRVTDEIRGVTPLGAAQLTVER
jgi:hypothetical protein